MSTSRYDLLPPNATQLERDLSRSISSLVRAEQPVPVIRTAKRVDTPASVIPWLIFEYGLGELLAYITNQQQAIRDGVLWQRIRGTPESVRVALGWIGIDGVIEEPEGGTARWAEYMLGLTEPAEDDATIDRIVGVAKISSPVRSRLQRIYAGYDFRRAVYDNCSWSDGSIYSDHSGVRPRPDWPQISYGKRVGLSVQASASAVMSHTEVIGILVDSGDRFRYDFSKWGDGPTTLNAVAQTSVEEGLSAVYQGQAWGPFVWQEKSWNVINAECSINVTTLEGDPLFPYVQLLLHLDGSSFVDSSSFNRTVTPSGIVTLVSDYSFSDQSAYQPSGAGPGFPDNCLAISPINIGANDDFFMEMWCRPGSVSNAGLIGNTNDAVNQQILAILNGQLYHVNSNYGGEFVIAGGTVAANTGQWLAVGRTNNTVRLFVNGVVVATRPNSVGSLTVDRIGWSLYRTPYIGFYDEVRITAGPAGGGAGRHTSSYTPPAVPFFDA